jgi:hypothetical protein
MPAPTPQDPSNASSWFDDPAIANGDQLVRFVAFPHLVPVPGDTGKFEISPKVFAGRPGISVELERTYPATETADTRTAPPRYYAARGVSAGAVRATPSAFNGDQTPQAGRLGVCHTPDQIDLQTGQPSPNPHHCDIFPQTAKKTLVQEALLEQSCELVPVRSDEAVRVWMEKFETWPTE